MRFSDRYERALIYAAQLHYNQFRKVSATENLPDEERVPYITHLVSVSALVQQYGGDEDQAIAALLHDAIEDGPEVTQKSVEQIRGEILAQFGDRVLRLVEGCTQSKDEAVDWWERKQHYIDRIPEAPADVRLVSNADKLHNATAILRDYRAIGESLWERFSRGKHGVVWYHWSLARAFHAAEPSALTRAHANTVSLLLETAGVAEDSSLLQRPEN
ncbi:MAG: HD domain-containing protein [Cyanobacteria bacterium J06648_11]